MMNPHLKVKTANTGLQACPKSHPLSCFPKVDVCLNGVDQEHGTGLNTEAVLVACGCATPH